MGSTKALTGNHQPAVSHDFDAVEKQNSEPSITINHDEHDKFSATELNPKNNADTAKVLKPPRSLTRDVSRKSFKRLQVQLADVPGALENLTLSSRGANFLTNSEVKARIKRGEPIEPRLLLALEANPVAVKIDEKKAKKQEIPVGIIMVLFDSNGKNIYVPRGQAKGVASLILQSVCNFEVSAQR